jgi:hypothetical protein
VIFSRHLNDIYVVPHARLNENVTTSKERLQGTRILQGLSFTNDSVQAEEKVTVQVKLGTFQILHLVVQRNRIFREK